METVIRRVEGLAREGVFGLGDVVRVVSNLDDNKGRQSQLLFLRVHLKTDDAVKEIPVVVKIQVDDEGRRRFLGCDEQFANEVAMYRDVLPKLAAVDSAISGKMLYGKATSGECPAEDVIVLEDLRPDGYLPVQSAFLDVDHVTLALRTLGRFHGTSYKLKKHSPAAVGHLAESLHPLNYMDTGFSSILDKTIPRGFRPLIDEDPSGVASKALDKLTGISSAELWKQLRKPEEPFAVIIHGDFTASNLLFAYDDGKPVSVKFLDFGTSAYSDPTVDIALFLYLNVSPDLRAAATDHFLLAYWEGLTTVEPEPGFGFGDFLGNFGQRAIWGYLPCSFFLPMILYPWEFITPIEFLKLTAEERAAYITNTCSQKVTDTVSPIVRHLKDRGYLDKFVKHFDFS